MKAAALWLARKGLLFLMLVAAIGFYTLAWPTVSDVVRDVGGEALSHRELTAQIRAARDAAQARSESTRAAASGWSSATLRERLGERRAARSAAERRRDEIDGFFDPYRPSRILARKQAEIAIALADREIAVLEAALDRRIGFDRAQNALAGYATIPTAGALAASNRICVRARDALTQFDARSRLEREVRELVWSQRAQVARDRDVACARAERSAARRAEGLRRAQAVREARDALAAPAAIVPPLPDDFSQDVVENTVRDIMLKALVAIVAISLTPPLIRLLFYFVLAPLAARRPAIVIGLPPSSVPVPPAPPSTTSIAVCLEAGEEALVRQNYLQSSSMRGAKNTQWLLDWRHPLTSLASGMVFLTRVRGEGQIVGISAVTDPLAEVALLDIPRGAACVVRPRALAAAVQRTDAPLRVTSHWRLFSVPAWLTLQLRYLVFHGPIRLVLKGGRGVRVEAAEQGRIFGQDQLIGYSTDLAYSVTRTETFWPYLFGRERLLKDRVEAGSGVLVIEEAPLSGRRGLGGGLEGALDAALKTVGI